MSPSSIAREPQPKSKVRVSSRLPHSQIVADDAWRLSNCPPPLHHALPHEAFNTLCVNHRSSQSQRDCASSPTVAPPWALPWDTRHPAAANPTRVVSAFPLRDFCPAHRRERPVPSEAAGRQKGNPFGTGSRSPRSPCLCVRHFPAADPLARVKLPDAALATPFPHWERPFPQK